MRQTAIFPGRYVQAQGALETLAEEVQRLGSKVLLIASGMAEAKIAAPHLPAWQAHLELAVERFRGECSEEEIQRLTDVAEARGVDVVVGLGGGKVIDTAKAVAYVVGARTAVVPTIASTDAPTSAVAVIYTPQGTVLRYLFLPRNPDLVLVDTRVIAEAPVRYLVSGMGDALATWFEAESCRVAYAPNQCGGRGTLAGYALARLCYDTIRQYGVAAKIACQEHVVTPALSHVVEANTLLSGLGFESGGLAAAHSIHNGLTRLPATHSYYHGEKVAIGALAGLFLTDQPMGLVDEVYDFCESVGLPTTLAQIGLADATDEQLCTVAEAACAESETIHHEPCPVWPAAVFAALRSADQYGRRRQN